MQQELCRERQPRAQSAAGEINRNQKTVYVSAKARVIEFSQTDVVCASNNDVGENDPFEVKEQTWREW